MTERLIGTHKGSEIIARDIDPQPTHQPKQTNSPGRWRGPGRQRGEPVEQFEARFMEQFLEVMDTKKYGPFLVSRLDHGPGEPTRYTTMGFDALSNKAVVIQAANITDNDDETDDVVECLRIVLRDCMASGR